MNGADGRAQEGDPGFRRSRYFRERYGDSRIFPAGGWGIMTPYARIREQVVPISIAGVILASGYVFFTKMPLPRSSGEIAQWFLILAGLLLVLSILPAIAIVVGWKTGNPVSAFLSGAIPLPLVYLFGYFLISAGNMMVIRIPDTFVFIAVLSAICGLAGYCAARRTKNFLALSIVLTGIWLITWMRSFN